MGLEGYSNVSSGEDAKRLFRISKMEIPFGKHKGKTLDEVPADYLTWLAEAKAQTFQFGSIQKWVREYLKHPEIKHRIEQELQEMGE